MKGEKFEVMLCMAYTFVIFFICVFNSCKEKSEIRIGEVLAPDGYEMRVVTIDSCEYISYNMGNYAGLLTHKGNCKNRIHKCK